MILRNTLLPCLLISLMAPCAYALMTDSAQPLHITSNQFTYNDLQGTATYQGDVLAVQGSRHLTADTVVVRLDHDKQVSQVNAYGKPAHFHYQPKPNAHLVFASADNIEYQPSQNLLSLIGHAQIDQHGNILKGALITYNTQTEVAQSIGQPNASRPQVIIQPNITQSQA